jgi:hypothetical protein
MKLLIDILILAFLVALSWYSFYAESAGIGALAVVCWFLAFVSYFDDSGTS